MKAAIFGDLHLGVRQNSEEWHTIALQWCDWFVSELKKREIDTIFFLGDFFDAKFSLSVTTLHVAAEFLKKLEDFQIHMILGNHDLCYKSNFEVSAVTLFRGYNSIHLYSTPEIVEMGGKQLAFLGWGYNPLDYKADVLLCHAEVDMFSFNDFRKIEDGIKPSELLKRYKKVISGHIHGRQIKSWNKGSIEYVGNPFQTKYDDSTIDKVFAIIDLDDLSMEYVENDISPIFIQKKLSDIVEYPDLERFVNLLNSNFFELVLDMDITNADLNEIKRLISACNVRDAKFSFITKQDFNVANNDVKAFSIADSIMEYIDSIEVENKGELKSYILEIYNRYST